MDSNSLPENAWLMTPCKKCGKLKLSERNYCKQCRYERSKVKKINKLNKRRQERGLIETTQINKENATFSIKSEFNIQVELYYLLKQYFSDYQVYGEVSIVSNYRQIARLDLALFSGEKIILAVEVKKKSGGHKRSIERQKIFYEELGVPKVFICAGYRNMQPTIEKIKKYLEDNK